MTDRANGIVKSISANTNKLKNTFPHMKSEIIQ